MSVVYEYLILIITDDILLLGLGEGRSAIFEKERNKDCK